MWLDLGAWAHRPWMTSWCGDDGLPTNACFSEAHQMGLWMHIWSGSALSGHRLEAAAEGPVSLEDSVSTKAWRDFWGAWTRAPAFPQFCPTPPWRHREHSLMLAFVAAALETEGDCHPQRDPLCVLATGTRCGTALKVTREGAWNGRIRDNIVWIAVRLGQDLSKMSG